MKKLYVFSGLVALTCLIGIYCSKKSSDPEPPPASSNAPQIDSLSGPYAWPDEQLTIYGSRFGNTQDSTRHAIIWPDTVDVISWSDTLIETDIPNNLGVTHVTVVADEDTSNAMPFSVFGITSVEPEYAFVGDTIRIHGLGFGGSQNSNTVMIGGMNAHVVSWYYTLIIAIIPEGSESGEVMLTASGHVSSWQHLAITGLAYVSGIEPDWGPWGTGVSISGQRLGYTPGSSIILLGEIQAPIIQWSDTLIRTEVPEGASSGNVTVTIAGQTSEGIHFEVFRLHGIDPTCAITGETVSIIGEGFGSSQLDGMVTVGGLSAEIVSWSNNRIDIENPLEEASGTVLVTVHEVESNPASLLSYCEAPEIASINPTWGPWATSVDISGIWFRDLQGLSTLKFGEVEADVSYWSDTLIRTQVPEDATSGDVTITVDDSTSNGIHFVIFRVQELVPGYAEIGDTIAILGEGFGGTQSASTVTADNVSAEVVAWNNNRIEIVIPDGISSGPIVVTVNNTASDPYYFVVGTGEPNIIQMIPEWGPRGTEVELHGIFFGTTRGSSILRFGSFEVINIISWFDTLIVFEVPSNAITGHVFIKKGDIFSNEKVFDVYYLKRISPMIGEPGDLINIVGYGFGSNQFGSQVRIGSQPMQISSWGPTLIKCIIPENVSSDTISIEVNGIVQSVTGFITFGPLQITEVVPDSGCCGDTIAIRGSGFGDVAVPGAVTFDHPCLRWIDGDIVYWSDTLLEATVPGTAIPGDLIVRIGDRAVNAGFFEIFGIRSVTNPWGTPGYWIEIRGGGFGESQGDNMVLFEDVVGTINDWDRRKIVTELPVEVLEGNMRLIFNGVEALSMPFWVMYIEQVTPEWVAYGDEITIRGRHLGGQNRNVSIGGIKVMADYFSDTMVIATVPENARSGYIKIIYGPNRTNSLPIDVFHLDEVYPFWCVPGDTVTISGTGFRDYDPESSRIIIDDIESEILSWSDSVTTAIIPSNASGASVYLTTRGKQSNEEHILVREDPEIFELLALMNYVEVVYGGQMIFAAETECDSVTWKRGNVQWSIDSLSGGYQFITSNPFSGFVCKGLISPDGSMIDSLYCYYYQVDVFPQPGPSEDKWEELSTVSAENIELHEINEEDFIITFRVDGPVVEEHITYIDMFGRWVAGGWYWDEWQYIDTDWDNIECPPSITVTFEKR